MKIVYFTNGKINSTAAHAVNIACMCEAFQGLGHEVILVARVEDPAHFDQAAYFRSFGIRHRFAVVPVHEGKVPFLRSLRFMLGGMRVVRRIHPDLLFLRQMLDFLVVPMFPGSIIIERHAPASPNAMVRWLQGKLYTSPRVVGIVTITQPLRTLLAGAFEAVAGKIIVCSDGARLQDEGAGVKSALRSGYKVNVGYTGHLYAGRGVEVIVALAGRNPQIGFHVIGGNASDVDAWRRRTAHLPNLVFYGHLPYTVALATARSTDVLLAPYQDSVAVAGGGNTVAWMSPLKIFEYMAHSKPFICSDIPVLREVLTDGSNCLLVRCDDIDAWDSALHRLLADRDLSSRLVECARADLVERYSWDARARKIMGLVD